MYMIVSQYYFGPNDNSFDREGDDMNGGFRVAQVLQNHGVQQILRSAEDIFLLFWWNQKKWGFKLLMCVMKQTQHLPLMQPQE